MQSRATVALGMLIVSGSLALGGCGGGGGKRLTKVEFAARANAICTEFDTKLEIASAKNPQSSLKASLPLFHNEIESLKTLSPPLREQQTFDQAITLIENLSSNVAAAAAAMQKNDLDEAAALKLAREDRAIMEKSDALFPKLGAKECTSSAREAVK
jgi:hypothetical protein